MAASPSGFFPAIAHPTAGTLHYTSLPVLDGNGKRPASRRAPLLGEHTEQVLLDVLRLDGDEAAQLAEAGTVGH